jgi:spore germination protein YaaH
MEDRPTSPERQELPVVESTPGDPARITAMVPPDPHAVPISEPPYVAEPPLVHRRGGGCGCWIIGLIALFVAVVLVGIAALLPPFNLADRLFGTQYVMLDSVSNATRSDDNAVTLVLDPADTGSDFGVNLTTVSRDTFQTSNASADQPGAWIAAARAAIPPYLSLQSSVYDLQTTGTAPGKATFDVQIPANAANQDTLDVYGYEISTGRWSFLASQPNEAGTLTVEAEILPDRLALFQAAPPDPAVIVPVDITQSLADGAAQVATIVSPAGMQPTVDGRLVGSLAPGFNTSSGYRVMPVVRNFLDPRALDPDTVAAILNNSSVRRQHAQQLAAFAGGGNFSGVFIDYRSLPVEQRENFTALIRETKDAFRSTGLQLGVVVPAAENQEGAWQTGAYDWRAIGQYADYVQIDFGLDPQTFMPGPDRLVEAMLRWSVGEVSRYKLIAGVDASSVRELNGDYTAVSYDDALADLGNVEVEAETNASGITVPGSVITARLNGLTANPGLDTELQMPFVEYLNADETRSSLVWLMTGSALRARLDRFDQFGIGGVALEDLNASGLARDIFDALAGYKLQLPSGTQQDELTLRWRISDSNGLISEVDTGLNEPLTVTLEAVEGNFAVNVEVVNGVSSSVRSGAAVAQYLPTATATPVPTETPTLEPTETPTLAPIVPTEAPAATSVVPEVPSVPAGGGGAAVNPGAGSIVAGFEYGGHVTGTSSETAAGAMRQAGMTWMKVQVGYTPGKNPGDVAAQISDAHGRGFKILLGIVGTPGDLAAGGAGYIQGYASFLGGVAALGPDAIEVWNEPNLSREWPEGAISGANYTSMLQQAYQAIKGSNGSVLVISAALAPTGAEAAYPGQVVNDNNFLTQMVAAGALNSLDCVGVHYNEGIVPPDQSSGDPRGDNYYTRYFMPMMDTYWSITGGAKPLCFTELGYLTPEGFGALDPFFSWAQNVTVAQQSAWLARAISMASQSGRVRLLIVWNVDFSNYGADPMAGYAIVRPGGGCPACGAIAGAR